MRLTATRTCRSLRDIIYENYNIHYISKEVKIGVNEHNDTTTTV